MAPLSLLGTVIRDKMIKTVTVQVLFAVARVARMLNVFLRSLDYSLLDIFNCLFFIFFACSTAMTAQHRCYALLCIRCTSARRYKRWHARAVAMTSRKSSCKLNFFTTFSY